MALLLHIDTSGENGSVALSENGALTAFRLCSGQKEQAGFLQSAIKEILDERSKSVSDLSAVSVGIGPGSYTGLRVGLASAKGICFACEIPLITITSTYIMAAAAKKTFQNVCPQHDHYFLCPMIDARRMEVYAALYDENLSVVQAPAAFILDHPDMFSFNENKPVYCFGSGSEKWKSFNQNVNIIWGNINWDARDMIHEAARKFENEEFDALSTTTPLYIKPFYTNADLK
jgi:tRNA threonylcarbamoyladenosine biosynthesis protein TsaB